MEKKIKIDNWEIVKDTLAKQMKLCETEEEFEKFILNIVGGFLYANKDMLQQQNLNVDEFNKVNNLEQEQEQTRNNYIG
jgi:hypothetical protein